MVREAMVRDYGEGGRLEPALRDWIEPPVSRLQVASPAFTAASAAGSPTAATVIFAPPNARSSFFAASSPELQPASDARVRASHAGVRQVEQFIDVTRVRASGLETHDCSRSVGRHVSRFATLRENGGGRIEEFQQTRRHRRR